jgi:hypothetical protein
MHLGCTLFIPLSATSCVQCIRAEQGMVSDVALAVAACSHTKYCCHGHAESWWAVLAGYTTHDMRGRAGLRCHHPCCGLRSKCGLSSDASGSQRQLISSTIPANMGDVCACSMFLAMHPPKELCMLSRCYIMHTCCRRSKGEHRRLRMLESLEFCISHN